MSDFVPPTLLADYYKLNHREQYPKGTEYVYSTWIPRDSRLNDVNEVVVFGLQAFIKKYLIEYFETNFFNRGKSAVLKEYQDFVKFTLGKEPDVDHLSELHDLGFLPLEIRALPEGSLCPIRVPCATIENTDSRFFWLTNFLETLWSNSVWLPSTSATIAHQYRKILNKYALLTTGSTQGVEFQAHDFSMRGLTGIDAVIMSGMGHLLSFVGSDSIPAIIGAEHYYKADVGNQLIGTSIPATEHSVMCAGGVENEFETYRRLIEEIYPNGLVSIVSDTWDLWYVLTKIIPSLKSLILARDGKVVIRPDSGDPVAILCGDPDAVIAPARKGVVEVLWDTFGGLINDQGYKVLDPHIGTIYGDSITIERCKKICALLEQKGFASTNIVLGVGSFTYQYNTRDTLGWAMKATWVQVHGQEIGIFKDPVTDSGIKKSLKGRVAVVEQNSKIIAIDGLDLNDHDDLKDRDLLRPVFIDGELINEESFIDIRARLAASSLIR